jgi:acyl-CoA reductase-like NAD-dependent aldehyde dehydrogenase
MATTTAPIELSPVVGGRQIATGETYEVRTPYDETLVAVVHRAGPREIEAAIAGAVRAFETTRKLPSWKRSAILAGIADRIEAAKDDFARTIALEAGKPIKTARVEAERAAFTFRVASEETKRIYGEIVPLDWIPGNDGRVAHVRRIPLGPIAGISPFNFPINLVAHKVAPALAAGNPIIVRPASQTPISALKLAQIVLDAGWPEEGIAVVPSTTTDAAPLVEDDRIKLLTFTGSPPVGWGLKNRAGMKRVTLELGGNAAVVVAADADAEYAAERIVWGGTANAGQTCISVQRVYYHESLDGFEDDLVRRFEQLVVGDPLDEATDVGPLISQGDADRVERWLQEAVDGGARILTGGERDGGVFQPTVITVEPFGDTLEALDRAGASEFGLQAGLFTNDIRIIDAAFDRIEVGGLMVNDVSSFRVDHMPYGGVKRSGFGREGLRYAIEEMTELKLLTFNPRPL